MSLVRHELLAQFSCEYCCRNDAALTLAGDVSGFARLFGYTPGEISSRYGSSLLAMVPADSRCKLQSTISEQLSVADDIECVFPGHHKNGNTVWVLNRAVRQTSADGSEYIHGLLVAISKLKQAYDYEKEVSHAFEEQASKDSLTHIYNAYTSRKLAEAYIAEADQCPAALLIIDLDDFKKVNDSYGHMFGDAVLVQTAKIIKALFRCEDIVGRIGGEEFMVLMKGTADLKIIENRCHKLNTSLTEMFGNSASACSPSCSIGIALFPAHADSYFGLFRCADQALYYAKAQGKRQYALYDENNYSMSQGSYSLRFADYDENTLRGYIEYDEAHPIPEAT